MVRCFAFFAFCLLACFHTIFASGVKTFIKSPSLQGCSYSMLAVNLVTGDTLFDENANQRMIPASLLKLFTTGASLEILGEKYRFRTVFGFRGDLKNGVLNGDLVIQGFGDPTFGSSYFSSTHPDSILLQISQRIKEFGIKKILGHIIFIDNYFDYKEYPSGRLFEDVSNYYGATPQSLNWRDNSFTLFLNSSSTPDVKCNISRTEPSLGLVSFYSKVYSSNLNQDSAYIYPLNGGFVVRGSIPLSKSDFAVKGVLPSPFLQFANELCSYLSLIGVAVDTLAVNERIDDTIDFKPLFTLYSPTLADVIKVTNQKSVNLFADAIYLTIGKQSASKWQWSGAAQFLASFWKSHIFSILTLEDGSGMSPRNLITCNDVVSLLKFEFKSKNYNAFKNSLAVAGESGTLKGSFLSQKGRFYGKSGSMKGVLCYGGYFFNPKGEPIAVSVMVNNYVGKSSLVRGVIERLFIAEFK